MKQYLFVEVQFFSDKSAIGENFIALTNSELQISKLKLANYPSVCFDEELTGSFHWQIGNSKAFGFQCSAGIQHALVFGLSGYNVFLFGGIEPCYSLNGDVVALSCPRGENNFFWVSGD